MPPEPLRVLIVEDEAAILMQIEALVEDLGHEVVGTAMSSGEAIRCADKTAPDLVLLDMHLLDGATGIEVAHHLRNAQRGEVLFMTANASRVPEDYAGAIGVLAKPCSHAAVGATIRYLAECLRTPPPTSAKPFELTVAPAYERRMRAARS